MSDLDVNEIRRHCEVLSELAFEVFSSSQFAHHMITLEAAGDGVAFGDVAIHTHFAMSYAAFMSLRLYYLGNEARLKSVEIERFLRSYRDFSRAFSGNWVAAVGVDAIGNRFEHLEASYHALQTLLRNTRKRIEASVRISACDEGPFGAS